MICSIAMEDDKMTLRFQQGRISFTLVFLKRTTVAIFEPLFLGGSIFKRLLGSMEDRRNAKSGILPSVICYNDHILDCLHLQSFRTELGMFDCHSGPSQNVKERKHGKSHQNEAVVSGIVHNDK